MDASKAETLVAEWLSRIRDENWPFGGRPDGRSYDDVEITLTETLRWLLPETLDAVAVVQDHDVDTRIVLALVRDSVLTVRPRRESDDAPITAQTLRLPIDPSRDTVAVTSTFRGTRGQQLHGMHWSFVIAGEPIKFATSGGRGGPDAAELVAVTLACALGWRLPAPPES